MTLAILREPLLHFIVLGAAIFAAFVVLDDTLAPAPEDVLQVTDNDAARLVAQFEATWRRPPTAAERAGLIDSFVVEEALVREAVALGLDTGDAVVRQRLAQKMTFLLESAAEAAEATDEALAAHLASYPERFRLTPLVAFDQVLLRDAPPEETLDALQAGADPGALVGPGLLPASFALSPQVVVDSTFGAGFFEAISALPVGAWSGPVPGGYGPHLVRVRERVPGRVPELAEIREAVERDWRSTRRVQIRDARLEELLSRYQILRPESDAAQ